MQAPPGIPIVADDIPPPLPLRFHFEAALGEGGLGTVVKAYDTQLHTYVAIKTIRHDLRARDKEQYEHLVARFEREAIAGARPSVRASPYVVTVYDQMVDQAGNIFLVLQFAPGGTLRDRLKNGPLPVTDALRLTADAARGLQDLHAEDVVHRDIKPENLFLTANGRAMVGDLGIVQMSSTTFRTRLEEGNLHGHPGTPRYMSPEQEMTTGLLRPESDQYSLGTVLFELVTGRRYKGLYKDQLEMLLGALPAGVEALIEKMTAQKPEGRYRGMGAVLAAIEEIDPTEDPGLVVKPQRVFAPTPLLVQGRASTRRPPAASSPAVDLYQQEGNQPSSLEARGDPTALPLRRRAALVGGAAVVLGGLAAVEWAWNNLRGEETNSLATEAPTLAAAPTSRFAPTAASTVRAAPTVAAALAGESVPLQGYSDVIYGVAFSPDNQTLASGSLDKTVRLWRVGDGRLIHELQGHTDVIYGVAFSPDNQTLASGSLDKTVRLWRVGDGNLLRSLMVNSTVAGVAFSPDGQTLASGSGNAVWLWRVGDGSFIRELTGHTALVESVAFSPDGQTLVSASDDKTVRLWRVGDGSSIRELIGHTSLLRSVAFSPDGQTLASGGYDNMVRLWRVGDGSSIRALMGHTESVTSVTFSPDNQTLASGSIDKTVRLWRVGDGSSIRALMGHTESVRSVAFSPDGQTLVSVANDKTVRLWRV